MLDSLKETGRTLGREIGRAWDTLSDGWHELLSRSGNALTHFTHGDKRKRKEDEVQKLTDKYVADADAATAAKEKEILQV